MNVRVVQLSIFCCLLFLPSCSRKKEKLFKKLETEESGLDFKNTLSPTEDFNIIDYLYFYNGGGVSIGDINNDGLPDVYLSGNQVPNKLFLNKGNLKFEDITQRAGVAGASSWKTGSVMADVNSDGLLDIYVCAVVGLKNLSGHNELFINNGDNTFSERSSEFGLDFESYSSSAAFLDYDLDGDLDLYLLNHAVHTSESFGHSNLRNMRTYETGGKLLRNDGEKFVDVSEQARIYGGINGYGLGVAISDFNMDGYPDIYVSNDFHEDDYFYINNGDGTFSEQGKEALTLMSKFSMGNDVADINHDGYPDLITLDMLPEDERILKKSMDEENINILRIRTGKYGYHYQFPRNTLQINLGNGKFAETALMSGVAATDWSWSALFCDFDQDGNQDLFVSNGIQRRPNDLDYIKYVSSEEIVNTIGSTKLVDQKALTLMPKGEAQNYIYKGSGALLFDDKSDEWLPKENTCATATAYGDLDNDGDLDLVVNNVDAQASIYVNQTNSASSYLKVALKSDEKNTFGIGAKVYAYRDSLMQFKELYSSRGFQSSSEPIVHFGFMGTKPIDSLKVVWPSGKSTLLTAVKLNQKITVSSADAKSTNPTTIAHTATPRLFEAVDPASVGIDYTHVEDTYTDFDRVKLLPYQQSDRGPATAIGDLNNDGKMDVFFGGSKYMSSRLFLQSDHGYNKAWITSIQNDSINEEIDAGIEDFNGDQKSDLFIASGGADFYGKSKPLQDVLYESQPGLEFERTELPEYYENASCVRSFDYDGDGDKDLFVGNESVSKEFGSIPKSYLLKNDEGKLIAVNKDVFENLGMVTDAVWADYNGDGKTDLVVVGEWMSPVFIKNVGTSFELDDKIAVNRNGLWQSIAACDIDHDGDLDFTLGNWGLNSKFTASEKFPMKMFYNDFDQNGEAETIVAVEKNGLYYTLDGFDRLIAQIPSLKKKYTSYAAFAGQTVDQVFSKKQLDEAALFRVTELASGWLRNNNGKFAFEAFDPALQIAPIMAQLRFDFDANGKDDILLAGNYFGVQPFHGRFGSFSGALLKDGHAVLQGVSIGLDFLNQSVRQLNIISFDKQKYLLVTVNNGRVQLYKINSL